jgi:hypothetical protein
MARAVRAASGPQPKTAVVVIHGIGEQRPLETLRGFVETVYRRDRVLASIPVGSNLMLDVSAVPDDVTGSAELRRITTLDDGPRKRTDFFEFYWADIMDGTPIEMITGWIKTLLLRSPWRLPRATKVKRAWLALLAIVAVIIGAGLLAVHSGIAEIIESYGPLRWLGPALADIRPYLAALVTAVGIVVLVARTGQAQGDMRRVALGLPVGGIVAGLVLLAIPPSMAGSLAFWATALTAFVGWALNAVIGPYAGDVVRYVRATPSTVERRRQVRERGVALLEALHAKRLKGPSMEAFTRATAEDPPLYDRIVLVGHSLGTIIAYDILQLFWEKHGPTHHQDWVAGDKDVQAALAECDTYVQAAWADPPRPVDPVAFEASRAKLFELLRGARPRWRISDFITLGSPLAHAEFLLADSASEVDQAFKERRFATAPPHPDPSQSGSMLFRARGPKGPMFPHFAAQFAAVKWTNLYDEDDNPLIGDLISGRLGDTFGPGIEEHDLAIRRPGRPGALGRIFTHTQYWEWHASYEPSAENAEAARIELSDEVKRELLWHNVPEHIRRLRLALRLGT